MGDRRRDRETLLNTKQIRPRIAFRRRECPLMKSISKDAVVWSGRGRVVNDRLCSHIVRIPI